MTLPEWKTWFPRRGGFGFHAPVLLYMVCMRCQCASVSGKCGHLSLLCRSCMFIYVHVIVFTHLKRLEKCEMIL